MTMKELSFDFDNSRLYLEKFYRELQKINENIPTNRQFGIKINRSDSVVDIELHHQGQTYLLSNLLPEGCVFEEGSAFRYSIEENEVCFDPERLNKKGGLLSLLHEIRHSVVGLDDLSLSNIARTNLDKLYALTMTLGQKIYLGLRKAFVGSLLKNDASNNMSLSEFGIPEKFALALYQRRANSERDAWLSAVEMAQEIEKESKIDILSDFADRQDLVNFVSLFLSKYQFEIWQSFKALYNSKSFIGKTKNIFLDNIENLILEIIN